MVSTDRSPAERPLVDEPLAADQFVPGDGELLTTVVDLIESECPVDPTNDPPLGATVDWDALDYLLDDEARAMNIASVTFSYRGLVVRITGSGDVELYDDPDRAASSPSLDDDADDR